MTGFIRVESPYAAGDPPFLNLSLLDSAILAQTPVVTATSPAASTEPTFQVRWDNAVAAPGVKKLRNYDVQWLDEAEGVWHDWIVDTRTCWPLLIQGQPGPCLSLPGSGLPKVPQRRASLQSVPPRGRHAGPLWPAPSWPGVCTPTPAILCLARLSPSWALACQATTGPDGRYEMDVLAWPDPQVVTVSHPTLLAPAPVYGVTFGPTERVVVTWTLRPADDVVVNGGFEAGLDGWSPSNQPGGAPVAVAEPVHSGIGALALGSAAPTSLRWSSARPGR